MSDTPSPHEQHDHTALIFPPGFLWGAATSAYQVEGGNAHSDWWEFEKKQPPEKRSGEACDQYNRYEEDFSWAKKLNHNAHRLSIEWSRIEPEEGEFSEAEIEHYKKVLKSLKDKDIKVMLTLWHFTLPKWVADKGGWESTKCVHYFIRFVEKIVPSIKEYVDFWITVNEPGVYSWGAYSAGLWPPQRKSLWSQFKVIWNLASAHKKAYKIIHHLDPNAKVGMANNVFSVKVSQEHSVLQHFLVWLYDISGNHSFYLLTGKNTHDFLGLNYYFHQRIGKLESSWLPKFLDPKKARRDISDLGWELYPEGIFDILNDFSSYDKPIYITENGLASTNDDRRARFLVGYLQHIYHAISKGVDVRGYFYWSLVDNFEWHEGFEPRFGLIEVNYETQKRTPRPSAHLYAEIIQHNSISHDLLRLLGHTIKARDILERIKK